MDHRYSSALLHALRPGKARVWRVIMSLQVKWIALGLAVTAFGSSCSSDNGPSSNTAGTTNSAAGVSGAVDAGSIGNAGTAGASNTGGSAGASGTSGACGTSGAAGAGGIAGGEPPGPGTSPCDADSITVDSIAALQPYLAQDNVKVQLAPGTYRITPEIITDLFPSNTLFDITGSNSSYCFTGATIEFDTNIFRSFGNLEVKELLISGSNNSLKNLTMTDIGDIAPYQTALAIHIDGTGNLLEGFHLTVRGSEPYAYGDMFGKGSGYVIKHRKHAAILLTGTDTHVKDVTIMHHAYGHGIFMQGAIGVLIEGVYLEGETRTTDEVLAEVGTSAADRDFMTVWGWRVKPGYRFSLQEDGIRAYRNSANSRITSDVTIRDSVVKFMRSGVTIGLGDGPQHVENVTVLGNESGFWTTGNTDISNCRGDASLGPLYSEDVSRSGSTIDLTLLDSVIPKLGDTPAIYLAGNNHNLTLKDGTTSYDTSLELLVGGVRNGHRFVDEQIAATKITFDNQTNYPLILGNNSSASNITSCGTVSDNGTGNTVVNSTSCTAASAP